MKSEKVYLVGAGPGDPGLITKRGGDLLRQADVVVVDALVNPVLFHSLKARIIYVGKRGPGAPKGSSREMPQRQINQLLVRLAKAGKKVVRLKGGDPFVFGRGSEEVEALRRATVACDVIPGVSSATAVPTSVGIPITDRRFASQVTFITGQSKEDGDVRAPRVNWGSLSPNQTLVVLMGVSRWPRIRKRLLAEGWPVGKPLAAVEWGTMPHRRVVQTTLDQSLKVFEREKLTAPSVIVVGDVVRLMRKPLLGKRVIVTRPLEQSAELVSAFKKKGADVLLSPSIKIEPLRSNARLRRFGNSLKKNGTQYDWIVFLSVNAVETFDGLGLRTELRNVSVLAIGPQTKRAAVARGWKVKKIPQRFNSVGALAALGRVRGKKLLIPRAEGAPKDLIRALRRRGAVVDEVITYRTAPVRPSSKMKRELLSGVDAVVFTSSSTVWNFFRFLHRSERRRIFQKAVALSIGPQTSSALRQFHVGHVVEARNASAPYLVDAICRYFQSRS